MNSALKPNPIIVIAEHFRGGIPPTLYEVVCFAEAIATFGSNDIQIVVLGDRIDGIAAELAKTTGKDVIGVFSHQLKHYNGEAYKWVLHRILSDLNPSYVCIANASQGLDFAPGLAIRLDAACITGVESVIEQNGTLCFSKAVFGGKVYANLAPAAKRAVLTLQPGSYPATPKPDGAPGKIVLKEVTVPPQQSKTISIKKSQGGDLDLSAAKVVVSVGRGIGEEEKLPLIHQLAYAIPKAVACGSRPVIDAGWMPFHRQVGMTGATVAPELYLACGISGAAQHVSGMKGSAFIVSINTDPTAAIFNISDICIVEDLKTFIPLLITAIEKTTQV